MRCSQVPTVLRRHPKTLLANGLMLAAFVFLSLADPEDATHIKFVSLPALGTRFHMTTSMCFTGLQQPCAPYFSLSSLRWCLTARSHTPTQVALSYLSFSFWRSIYFDRDSVLADCSRCYSSLPRDSRLSVVPGEHNYHVCSLAPQPTLDVCSLPVKAVHS